jgi:hypothetical protein
VFSVPRAFGSLPPLDTEVESDADIREEPLRPENDEYDFMDRL